MRLCPPGQPCLDQLPAQLSVRLHRQRDRTGVSREAQSTPLAHLVRRTPERWGERLAATSMGRLWSSIPSVDHRAQRRARQRRSLIVVLACVLLSQWLALAHSIVHAPGSADAAIHASIAAQDESIGHALHDLVASHDAGNDACRLLDSLAHDLAPTAQPALAEPPVNS